MGSRDWFANILHEVRTVLSTPYDYILSTSQLQALLNKSDGQFDTITTLNFIMHRVCYSRAHAIFFLGFGHRLRLFLLSISRVWPMSKQRRQREDEDETTMSAGDGSDTDTRCPIAEAANGLKRSSF